MAASQGPQPPSVAQSAFSGLIFCLDCNANTVVVNADYSTFCTTCSKYVNCDDTTIASTDEG